MAKYYNADTLLEFIKNTIPAINGHTSMKCVERAIKEAPTADVVEVVRCKDCKHLELDITNEPYCKLWTDKAGDYKDYFCDTTFDNYCSYGERRTDDGKSY